MPRHLWLKMGDGTFIALNSQMDLFIASFIFYSLYCIVFIVMPVWSTNTSSNLQVVWEEKIVGGTTGIDQIQIYRSNLVADIFLSCTTKRGTDGFMRSDILKYI